jgi:Protein kinase domain.
LPEHPNLLGVLDHEIVRTDNGYIAYVILELCEGGSLFDLMVKHEHTKLNEKQIVFIMREICEYNKLDTI